MSLWAAILAGGAIPWQARVALAVALLLARVSAPTAAILGLGALVWGTWGFTPEGIATALLFAALARSADGPPQVRWALSAALLALGNVGIFAVMGVFLWGMEVSAGARPQVLLGALILWGIAPRGGEIRGEQGFSAEVRPGARTPRVGRDPVLCTVRGAAVPYMRVTVLPDWVDGAWRADTTSHPALEGTPPADAVELEITREGALGGYLCTAGWAPFPQGVDAALDAHGGWHSSDQNNLHYKLLASPPWGSGGRYWTPPLSLDILERLTAVPSGLRPVLEAQARALAGDARTPEEAILRLEEGLRRGWRWREGGRARDLAAFLTNDRSGHCEHFSSALAMLARTRGLPTRVVSGLANGEQIGEETVFRASDAHAWVEVYLPGSGWTIADASPLAEGARPVEERVRRSLRRTRLAAFPLLWGALGLVATVATLRLMLRPSSNSIKNDRPTHALHRAFEQVARRGWVAPEALAPLEAAQFLREQGCPQGNSLVRLAEISYLVRYAGVPEHALHIEIRSLEREITRSCRGET